MTKREFIRLLARKGIPYFDYSPEELAEEFETVEAWGEVYQDVLAEAGEPP
jgi:predicted HTH domain antitoxin